MNKEKETLKQKFNKLVDNLFGKFETVKTKEGDLELLDGKYMKDGLPVSGDYTLILEDGSEKLISLKDGVEVAVAEIPVAASEDVIEEVVAPVEADKTMEVLVALMERIKALEDKMNTSNVAMEAKFNSLFKPKETKENKEEFSKVENPFKRSSTSKEQSFSSIENPFKRK